MPLLLVALRTILIFYLSFKKGGGFGGMFGMLKGLVGSKSLSQEEMEPVLEKMKDHLIGMTSHLCVLSSSPSSFSTAVWKGIVSYSFSRFCLVGKNVAADIASKLCESVAKKLEGKVMGTFTSKSP